MEEPDSAGRRFHKALAAEQPLQIVGVINAYAALLAKQAGFQAIYLSGGGVAAGSLGAPDLGIITLEDILTDVRRITDACDLPLLVDVDTGFGNAFNIARAVKALIKYQAAGLHIEDQVQAKRCGHRPGKVLVSPAEMVDRLKAALDARSDPSFLIMARTDAVSVEGIPAALDRAAAYTEAGADAIFAESVPDLDTYRQFAQVCKVPILANMTEFGQTPLFTTTQLAAAEVSMALYPLSAFRAMNAAALKVFTTIRTMGSQASLLAEMQSRDDLYDILGYIAYEQKLDHIFTRENQE